MESARFRTQTRSIAAISEEALMTSRIRSRDPGHARVGSRTAAPSRAPTFGPRAAGIAQTAAATSARLTIGKLAQRAGISTDTIRFYEDERLLKPAAKSPAGYRLFSDDAVRRLVFIRHAQQCGMTLAEIRALLELKTDDTACCRDVRSLAIRKKLELEHKIKTMTTMSQALSKLIAICTAEHRPLTDCPILAALESSGSDGTSQLPLDSKP